MTKNEPTDRERLTVLRARLEAVLADPATTPRDLATCSREYRLLLASLAESKPATGSKLDEISARRKKRGTA